MVLPFIAALRVMGFKAVRAPKLARDTNRTRARGRCWRGKGEMLIGAPALLVMEMGEIRAPAVTRAAADEGSMPAAAQVARIEGR